MFVDPFELVKTIQPGLMIYGRAGETPGSKRSIFLIREEDKYIKSIGYNPVFQLRVGMFKSDSIAPIVMMVRVNNNPDMTYDAWFNYYDMNDGRKNFLDMCNEEKLIFRFYNNQECKRTLSINNELRESFNSFLEYVSKIEPWSMKNFDIEKQKIYNQYSPQKLWENLGK